MPVYTQVNEKVLHVALAGEEVFARKGSMVATKGDVLFARSFLGGGGVQQLAMRAVTNEGIQLMSARGHGEVWYGHRGLHVSIVPLRGERLCVEADNVLAFDSRLRAGTSFLGSQGLRGLASGVAAGQGLFTSTFEGHGEVALLSDGDAIGLEVTSSRPVSVDPQAYLGHKGNLDSTIVTDVNWKTLLGQTSGESYQLRFTGQGTVYIQASEK